MTINANNLQKLLIEKKYSKLIFLIENTLDEKDLTGGILNLLGVARVLRGPREPEILVESIKNFKECYFKEKYSKIGLDGLSNLINTSVGLFDLKYKPNEVNSFYQDLEQLITYFKEAESHFGYNSQLVSSIIKVYKRLNDIDSAIFYLEELIKNNNAKLSNICSYIYYNGFIKKWTQKDYLNNSKLLEKHSPIYDKEKLSQLKKHKEDRIKLGFLSSDIQKKHSVVYFLKTVLMNYNKEKFEIILFLNNKNDDQDTEEIKKLVDKNIKISQMNDIQAINLIRNEKIDIMIDLMGITSNNRIPLFKNRISPIQVSWLGYCNTTGLKNMDYIIADRYLIYDEELNDYSEKVIFLDNIWNCHSGLNVERNLNELSFKNNQYITFGSFNNFGKVNDKVIDVWSQILIKNPNSRLALKSSLKKDVNRMKERFKKNGVLESIIFYNKQNSLTDHLNLYKEIDVALDTFPYNGVTTSFEAIWMGVPVLTMKGFNFNSRCGESINKNLKLDELVAENEDDYIRKAGELVNNPEKLISIKKFIFDNAPSSPLFDVKKHSKNFYENLENIYKTRD